MAPVTRARASRKLFSSTGCPCPARHPTSGRVRPRRQPRRHNARVERTLPPALLSGRRSRSVEGRRKEHRVPRVRDVLHEEIPARFEHAGQFTEGTDACRIAGDVADHELDPTRPLYPRYDDLFARHETTE